MSDQKYRQHGYQDRDRDQGKNRGGESLERPPKKETFGPRAMQMAASHAVSRCAQCGTLLQSAVQPDTLQFDTQCGKCQFDLHSCKQCTHFDPSARFECTQAIPERIPRKDLRNRCTFYSISVRVEKQTSTPASAKPADARQAFENLFKK